MVLQHKMFFGKWDINGRRYKVHAKSFNNYQKTLLKLNSPFQIEQSREKIEQ